MSGRTGAAVLSVPSAPGLRPVSPYAAFWSLTAVGSAPRNTGGNVIR
jgi:hypothetical protein